MGTELSTLPFIAHEMFATAGASLLTHAFAVEQVAMGIPPSHATLVRAEAALTMPWAEHEPLSALGTNATFNRGSLLFKSFWTQITQTKGFHGISGKPQRNGDSRVAVAPQPHSVDLFFLSGCHPAHPHSFAYKPSA